MSSIRPAKIKHAHSHQDCNENKHQAGNTTRRALFDELVDLHEQILAAARITRLSDGYVEMQRRFDDLLGQHRTYGGNVARLKMRMHEMEVVFDTRMVGGWGKVAGSWLVDDLIRVGY